MSIITVSEAEDLAARTLAAIPTGDAFDPCRPAYAADRERVASDLAGLRLHVPHEPPYADLCDYCSRVPVAVPLPCDDAARYEAGLRRTAALYGVQA